MTGDLILRAATIDDLPAIVEMLADDPLGSERETPDDLAPYIAAWQLMQANDRVAQIVGVIGGDIVSTMQLVVIPGLSHRGGSRLLIEAVRVKSTLRGGGIGSRMIEWAIAYGRGHGCTMVELTTHKRRTDAHRFYERLGFTQSHLGYKLDIS